MVPRVERTQPKKKPRGVSSGANFSFFLSKEVTANSVGGYRTFLLLLDLDLIVFVVVILLASKSRMHPICRTGRSYTSLGQNIKSKTCAKWVNRARNSVC